MDGLAWQGVSPLPTHLPIIHMYVRMHAPEVLDEAGGEVADAGQALHRVITADDLVVCVVMESGGGRWSVKSLSS